MGLLRTGIFFLLLFCTVTFAAGGEEIGIPDAKTADYYALLLKRPRPGYLFDRFLNSWIDHADAASLHAFLKGSDEAMAPLLLAFYYDAVNEPAMAAALYAEQIAAHPERLDLLYYKASADAESGAYEQAVDGLNALLEQKPAAELEIQALRLLGRSLLRLNRRPEGLAAWERLFEASGRDPEVADELLEMQLAEGLYEEALANCDALFQSTDDAYRKVMLLSRRAAILVRMDRRADAVGSLREAFALTGEESWLRKDILSRIEWLYRGADDLPGLARCLVEMLEAWPGTPSLLKARTTALLSQGQDEETLASARELVRRMPGSREVRDWYIGLLIELRDYDEAVNLLEEQVERYPDDPSLRLRLAEIYHRLDNRDKVREWILAGFGHGAKTEADYLETARILARYGLDNEATSVFLEMLAQWPDSAEGREAVAAHLSRESGLHLQQAWIHYEWLAERCDAETLVRLASTLLAAGSPERAETLLLMRRNDFSADYRYLTALFDVMAVDKNPEARQAVGYERLLAAGSVEETELAASALAYEIRNADALKTWIEKLTAGSDPSTADVWLLASLHQLNGADEKADAVICAALERRPGDEQLLQCRLMAAKRARNAGLVETMLIELIETYPTRASIWIRELVPLLIQAGRTDEALQWIERWKKASPNAVRPYELERDALVAAGRAREAIEAMRRAALQFDESIELKLSLGRLYETQSLFQEAEHLYWRMLNAEETLDGRMARLSDLIRVNQSYRGLDELIRTLQQRAENAPTAVFPLMGLAECYRLNHRMNERAEVMDRLLELRPDDVESLSAMASLKEDMGDYAAARDLMLRIADRDPSGTAYAKLAEFEALYGEPAVARAMMDEPRLSENPEALLHLMSGLLEAGSAELIGDRLATAAAAHPDDYRFAYLQARLLEERGSNAEAAACCIRLLALETERPGAPQAASGADPAQPGFLRLDPNIEQWRDRALREWVERYGAWIPPELLNMYSMATHGYARRMNRNSGYGSAPLLRIPDSLAELKEDALERLRLLVDRLSAEERDGVFAAVDEMYPYIGLLWSSARQHPNQPEWWQTMEERYPASEDLRLLRLLVAAYSYPSEETLREAIEAVQNDYPELALNALQSGVQRYPDLISLVPDLMERLELSSENLELMTGLSMEMLRRIEPTNALYAAAVELFERVEAMNGLNEELPPQMRFALSAVRARIDGDYTALVNRMREAFYAPPAESEADAIVRAQTGIRIISRTMTGWSVRGGYVQHDFRFPPYQLPEAEASSAIWVAQSGPDQEQIRPVLQALPEDDLFRWFMLAHLGGDSNTLAAAAAAIEAKPRKSPDELFMLACRYASIGEVERALRYVLQLYADADETATQVWSRDILNLTSRLKAIPDALYEPLKTFCDDFRKSLPGSDRSAQIQWVTLMEMLDTPLDELAGLITAANPAASPVSRSRRTTSGARRRAAEFSQQIAQALQAGEIDTALARVAVMARSEALREIHPRGGSQRQINYQLRNSLNYITNQQQEEKFLAQFAALGTAGSARERFEYGYVLELLGRDEEAAPVFEAVFRERPDWAGARIRYCMNLAGKDPEQAAALMAELPSAARLQFVEAGQQLIQNNQRRFEDRLELIDLVLRLIAAEDTADENQHWQMVQRIENALINQWYYQDPEGIENKALPDLYHASEKGALADGWVPPKALLQGNMKYDEDEALMKVQRRRRECWLSLLQQAATGSAQYGRYGFSRWTAYIDFSGAEMPPDELFETARRILSRPESANYRYNLGGQAAQGRPRDPLEVYAEELRRRGGWSDAEQLMKESIAEGDRKALGILMELQQAGSDAEYREIISRHVKALNPLSESPEWMRLVMEFNARSEHPVDIGDSVWEAVEKDWGSRLSEPLSMINTWARIGLEQNPPVDVAETYRRFFDRMLTEAEKKTIAEAEPGSISHQTDQQIYMKYQAVSQAIYSGQLPPAVLSALLVQIAPIEEKMMNQSALNHLSYQLSMQAADPEWCRQMGLLNDIGTFPAYALLNDDQSLLTRIGYRLNGDVGKPLKETLEGMEERTFGVDLMLAMVSDTNWGRRLESMIRLLAQYETELAAAPALRDHFPRWIMEMERNQGVMLSASSFKDEAGRRGFGIYKAWCTESGRRYAEQLSDVRLAEYLGDSYGMEQRVINAVRLLIPSDPETARELFLRSRRMSGIVRSMQGGGYDDRTALQQLFGSPSYSPEEIRFALGISAELDRSAEEWLQQQYLSQMSYRLEQQYRNQGMNSREARLAAAREYFGLVLRQSVQIEASILFSGTERIDSSDRPALAEWIREQDFDESVSKALVLAFLEPDTVDEAWLSALLTDDEVSASSRLSLFASLSRQDGPIAERLNRPALLLPLVELLDEQPDVRMPAAPFRGLIQYVAGLEAGEGQSAWIDRLLALWRAERVDGAPSDLQTVYGLAGLAAETGRADSARRLLLSDPNLRPMPATYAVALRLGLDDFVVEYLPGALLQLHNGYGAITAWLSPSDAERAAGVAARAADPRDRLMMEIFFAVLRIRDGDQQMDRNDEAVSALMERALTELDDPDRIRWVAVTMSRTGMSARAQAVIQKVLEISTLSDVLRNENLSELAPLFVEKVKSLSPSEDREQIGAYVDELLGSVSRSDLRDYYRTRLCETVVAVALDCDEPIRERGIELGVKILNLQNPNGKTDRAELLKRYGLLDFDPAVNGFNPTNAVVRFNQYNEFGQWYSKLQPRFDARCRTEDTDQAAAIRTSVRKAIMTDWLERAGPDGFLPLRDHITRGLRLDYASPEELDALSEWLSGLEPTLMVDQYKACVAYIRLRKARWQEPERWQGDLTRYLVRDDLDPAEAMCWVVNFKRTDYENFAARFRAETMAALQEESLMRCFVGELLNAFPIPASPEEIPIYEAYADGWLATMQRPDYRSRAPHFKLDEFALTLLALGRNDEASKIMNDPALRLGESPRFFVLALQAGQTALCASNLSKLVTSYVPPLTHEAIVESTPALQKLIDAAADPDVRVAAQLLFEDLARDTRKQPRPDYATPAPEHAFKDPLLAYQVRRLLVMRGRIEPLPVDPGVSEWIAAQGMEALMQRMADLNPLELEAFLRHLEGLVNIGDIDTLLAVYQAFAESCDNASVTKRVNRAVMKHIHDLILDVLNRRCRLPAGYKEVDVQQWIDLLEMMAAREPDVTMDLNFRNLVIATYAVQEKPIDDHLLQRLNTSTDFACWRFFRLYSGILRGDMDEAALRCALDKFIRTLRVFKSKETLNTESGRKYWSWERIVRDILYSSPFSQDKPHWFAVLDELIPEEQLDREALGIKLPEERVEETTAESAETDG